jgi:hypothetical protein
MQTLDLGVLWRDGKCAPVAIAIVGQFRPSSLGFRNPEASGDGVAKDSE